MCQNKNCRCNNNSNPVVCMSYQPNQSCEDRLLTTSNTTDSQGYEGVTMITPEVNQISAYKSHLEFVNSTEPLSGIKKHTVLRIAQSFIDGITGLISNFIGRNVGMVGAAEIYKGSATVGSNTVQDFRKIAGSPSIDVVQVGDNIVPSVDEEWLQEQIPLTALENVGDGIDLYSGMTGTTANIRNVKGSESIDIEVDSQGNAVFSIITPADENIKQYYVNETYPNVNGNGSIYRPYKKLTHALRDIIGTGTRVQPQFPNSIITLQTNVSITQVDLNEVPKLVNQISVNNTTIQGDIETRRIINFNGTVTQYPIDTVNLITQALNGSTSLPYDINISFINIDLINNNLKGDLRHWTYDGHGNIGDLTEKTSGMSLVNVKIRNRYLFGTSSYVLAKNSDGTTRTLFGQPVYCQSTIVNDTPHVYLYGLGNNNAGNISIQNLELEGSSQEHLRVQNTTLQIEGIKNIITSDYYANVADQTKTDGVYLPKPNLFGIKINGAYIRGTNFISESSTPINTGGFDSFIRLENTTSYPSPTFFLEGGRSTSSNLNYLVSVDQAFGPVAINNFKADIPRLGAFQKTGSTAVKTINVEGSTLNNVKAVTTSGQEIQLNASNALINSYTYSNRLGYADDIAALAAGLIIGNQYFNTTTQLLKRIE